MSDPKTWEQVRRLKAMLKEAILALDNIYQRKGEELPEMKAAIALAIIDGMRKLEDEQ